MSLIVSKELVSSIISKQVVDVYIIGEDIVIDWNDSLGVNSKAINVYKFAYQAKLWAIAQGGRGYILHSHIKHTKAYARLEWYEKNHKDQHGTYRECTFYSDWFVSENNNEVESILKAAEWILNIENA